MCQKLQTKLQQSNKCLSLPLIRICTYPFLIVLPSLKPLLDPRKLGRSLESSVPSTALMQRLTVGACTVERPRGSRECAEILEQGLVERME
jgi:hypothetical protein